MRLLLDTHTFLWWLDGDRRMSKRARTLVGRDAHEVFVSAASAWEIAAKWRLGKLPGAADVAADIDSDPIGRGLEAIAVGFGVRYPEDMENLSHQFEVYDALYAWCRLQVANG